MNRFFNKIRVYTLALLCTLMLGAIIACGDEEKENTGKISFWKAESQGCGDIRITLDGHGSRTLSVYIPSGNTPDCGAKGTVTFDNLPYGTYSYTAADDCEDGEWSGKITLDSGCCVIELQVE